ncbi:MAG TPA: hypothetical protein VF011_14390 [Terriglobales bacterium]
MRKSILLGIVVSASLISAIAGTAKVDRIDRPSDSPVPTAVWDVLDTKGYRLTLEDGSTACDIWLRLSLPSSGAKEVEGVLFPEIAPSTLVGLISFAKPATDFRGQPIKAGFYSLRYALLPNDGNHLGVAPSRDFVLLVPASADPDPGAQFKFEELVNLSKKATGTNHPGPLSLVQADSSIPGISHDDQDHWIFSVKVSTTGEQIPIGLIVKGTAQQ